MNIWNLAFITPVKATNKAGETTVLQRWIFENAEGTRASVSPLAGPWDEEIELSGVSIDGAPANGRTQIDVVETASVHGPILRPVAYHITLQDPTVTTVPGKTGGDGKPLHNLTGGMMHLSTVRFVRTGRKRVSAAAPAAPIVAENDEPALS
jgi:hypothetical protein